MEQFPQPLSDEPLNTSEAFSAMQHFMDTTTALYLRQLEWVHQCSSLLSEETLTDFYLTLQETMRGHADELDLIDMVLHRNGLTTLIQAPGSDELQPILGYEFSNEEHTYSVLTRPDGDYLPIMPSEIKPAIG